MIETCTICRRYVLMHREDCVHHDARTCLAINHFHPYMPGRT